MGLQSEPPPHREVIETQPTEARNDKIVDTSEPPPHREVIETRHFYGLSSIQRLSSEPPPHREVLDPNPRYPKKISGIFLCKKLKKLACPGIHSERKSS